MCLIFARVFYSTRQPRALIFHGEPLGTSSLFASACKRIPLFYASFVVCIVVFFSVLPSMRILPHGSLLSRTHARSQQLSRFLFVFFVVFYFILFYVYIKLIHLYAGHRPMYSSAVNYSYAGQPVQISLAIQQALEDLFLKYEVTLFVNGHVSIYAFAHTPSYFLFK